MQASKCESCEEEFNLELKKPRRLVCGCVLCERCLKSFYNMLYEFNCKKHNMITDRPIEQLEIVVLHLQEKIRQNLQSICQVHKEPLTLYCIQDRIGICEKCQQDSHQNHKSGRQEEVILIIQDQIKLTLSSIKKRLQKYSSFLGH